MPSSRAKHHVYSFGEFALDVDRGALLRAGIQIKLRPKSFEVLRYLVKRNGKLVSRDELLDAIWGDTVVTKDAVTQCLIDIRRAVDDNAQKIIQTVPRRGVIFNVPVTESGDQDSNVAIAQSLTVAAECSIAVLPFLDMSSNQDQAYFADGISEEITNLLTQLPGLRVIARTSSFSFKDKSTDIATIRSRLNVTHVLEGSVRKDGNQVRIAAQLIDAVTSTHLWSQTYDRALENTFAVQDEIAENVATKLQVILHSGIPSAKHTDRQAYLLYLQAQFVARQGSPEGFQESIDLLNQVLAIDETYAPAWSELSRVLSSEVNSGLRPMAEGIEDARIAATRALDSDPNLPSAHVELSWIAMKYDWDYPTAIAHLEAAKASDRFFLRAADLARIFGRFNLAVDWGRQAILIDPVSPVAYNNLAISFVAIGRFGEAEQLLQKAIKLSPNMAKAQFNLANLRLIEGKPQSAIEMAKDLRVKQMQIYILSKAYFVAGDVQRSDEQIDLFKRNFADESAGAVAEIYAFRNQVELAFEWWEKAYENRDSGLSSIRAIPSFIRLRSHPRTQPFLSKIGLSDEQLGKIDLDFTRPRPTPGAASSHQ